MLKRYSEFISESLEFLLESDVVYSDKFRRTINTIESPIAKKLLEIENKDLPVRSNYFDIIKDKNDSITFLPDRKAQEILKDNKEVVNFVGGDAGWLKHSESNNDLFTKLGYTPVGTNPYKPNSSDIGEIVSKIVSEESGKTYCWVKFKDSEGKELGEGVYNKTKLRAKDETESKLWGRGRQEIGVGRGVRALLLTTGEKFLDKDIEEFVNLYKTAIDRINNKFFYFDVVKGDDIYYWYSKRNYVRDGGTLNSSCMASVDPEYFNIYAKNPERISMVIYKDPENTNLILGRALLWKLNDGKMFMDRIYSVNDSDVQLFRQYAKENGWYSKYYNSSSNSGQSYAPDGSQVTLNLTVSIKQGYYDKYPYVDTLKYWDPSDGMLSNRELQYKLESTDGEYETSCESCNGSGRIECYECGGGGEQGCSTCDERGEVDCSTCGESGKFDCSVCEGSGKQTDDEENEIDCSSCEGSGQVDCPDCDGKGKEECSDCGGKGNVECENCSGNGDYECPDCQ